MGVIYASVDMERYAPEQNGTLVLSGWRGSETPEAIRMICMADTTEVPIVEEKYQKRTDVFEVCKTLSREDMNVGFEIVVTGLNGLMEKYQTIRFICCQGSDQKVIWEKAGADLKKEKSAQTLIRNIDSIRRRGNQMAVVGWMIDYQKDNQIKVQDDSGNPIPYELKQIARPDVCRTYKLKDVKVVGFEITVARKDLKNHKFIIRFENSMTVKETEVDVKKYDFVNSPMV